MDEDKKNLKIAKSTFDKLKIDPSSATFAEEILDKKLLLKLQKSKYAEDKKIFKLVNLLENNVIFEPDNVTRTDMLKKGRLITLHSIVLKCLFNCFMLM